MGNHFQIVQIQDNNNIMHFTAEIILSKPQHYSLEINSQETYPTETYHNFTATAKIDETTITNAQIEWSSSNSSVCQIIQDTGEAYFNREGEVTITAKWLSNGTTATTTFNVVEDAPLISQITFTGNPEIKEGNSSWKYFTASFKDAAGEEDTNATPKWEIEFNPQYPKQKDYVTSTISGNRIGLKAKKGSADAGINFTTFTLHLHDEAGDYAPTSQEVMITSLF